MLSECKTSKETYAAIAEIVGRMSLEEVQAKIAEDFYNVEKTVEILYYSATLKENCILYGPAGFGKSAVAKAFYKLFDITPYVKVGDSSTEVESLLGIPNIKKIKKDSEFEIVFEKSIFMFAGPLFLEEFIDVRPSVASSLKDVITEGGYRRRDELIASKHGPIIICSNKSPAEVSIDASTSAFYKERFLHSAYIAWESYERKFFLGLFNTVFKPDELTHEYQLIAELCSRSCRDDIIISPRMSLKIMTNFLITKSITYLYSIESLDMSHIDSIRDRLRIERQNTKLDKYLKDTIGYLTGFKSNDTNKLLALKSGINKMRDSIKLLTIHSDTVINTVNTLLNIMNDVLEDIELQLLSKGNSYNSKIKQFNDLYVLIQTFD